jgi:hypothetical protein
MKFPFFFIVCLALLGISPISASATDFYAGVKAGIGLSSLWGNNSTDSSGMSATLLPGFCGGVSAALHFSEYIGGQIEVLYFIKGKTSGGDYPALSLEKQWKTDYLEIPLLLKAYYPIKNALPLIYIGPSFAFTLSSKYRVMTQKDDPKNRDGFISTDTTYDIRDKTSLFDAGLAVGGGMEFSIETGAIIFDVRYTPGFISREKNAGLDIKNYMLSFMVGYVYKF